VNPDDLRRIALDTAMTLATAKGEFDATDVVTDAQIVYKFLTSN
jgi:hypothetical protein